MLGIVKPADALRRVATILVVVVLLLVLPAVVLSIWSGMSLWQQFALIAIGVCVIQWLRPRRKARKRKEE